MYSLALMVKNQFHDDTPFSGLLISPVLNSLRYQVHVRQRGTRGGGSRGRRRRGFWRPLKHAGLRCLQKTTIVRSSPIDCANRLLSGDITDSTTNQHLWIDISFL